METLDFNFSSDPHNRFPIHDADGNLLEIVLDRAQGLLRVTRAGAELGVFPLVEDKKPCEQAVFLRRSPGAVPVMEFGSVDYLGQAEYLEDYPLNDPDMDDEWKVNLADGGIVILDIRNLGRMISTVYSLDLVPVVLSMTGIYLRVATLKFPFGAKFTPWYEQVSRPRP